MRITGRRSAAPDSRPRRAAPAILLGVVVLLGGAAPARAAPEPFGADDRGRPVVLVEAAGPARAAPDGAGADDRGRPVVLVGAAGPARAAPDGAGGDDREGPVVLVLVRDLTWLTAPASLDGFAKASLSMRTAEAGSDAADVYVTLGKGRRSSGLAGEAGIGRVEPTAGGGLRLVDWPDLQDRDRKLRYGGTLGSVGQALLEGGRRWALAGAGSDGDADAAAVAATAEGLVPRVHPGTLDGIGATLREPLDAVFVAIAGSDLVPVLRLLEETCTVVVSASTPSRNRHLGVLATSGRCGLGTAGLASSSTHHAHLATLPDVSRTFLDLVGVRPPSSVAGAVVTPAGPISREALVDRDERTWTADRSRTAFVWLFVLLHALGAAAAVLWRRGRTVVCCALLGIPAASFLMMLVPWWRAGPGVGLLVGGVLAFVISVGGALVARRDVVLGVGLLAGVTSAVVAVDALFGSPLQIDAPFGNSPAVAGRFFGVGNIGSGLLVAGLLVAGGLAIDRWSRRSAPWVVAAVVAGAVAGGAPQFGADVGGVLFAVPAFGLLLLGLGQGRVTARHVVLLAVAAVAAVGLFAVVDLARGTDSQTHLAKGLGGEGLGDEVIRKAGRAVKTAKAPMANLVWIATVALVLSRYSPGPRRALRFASYAVVVAAILGSVLNDSGVNVAAAVLAVAWPAGVAVAAAGRPA